ncbi:DinB family protein [Fictibacillus sp. KIGAM418]|uniref:DinB family protein n=1 Tax=Fictibacillus marinisediminis TaxID=2878389 RepID=A0A9X2BB16_9BACL|nr:DinB family protein [Fictibacillus marinisediminis]MCK6255504.1 DinB family protein [Fictibacillus marinisediminis]
MNKLVSELESNLSSMPKRIKTISDLEAKPLPSKWSKKEILGHLCDSGNVNHQRFVDIIASTQVVTLKSYNQDFFVEIHDYQHSFTVEDILQLWISINKQIAALLVNVSEEQWKLECKVDAQNIQTLEWLVRDYIDHMNHHLGQILAD